MRVMIVAVAIATVLAMGIAASEAAYLSFRPE